MDNPTVIRQTHQQSVDVVVVGSLNLDVSVPVAHLPEPGETVLGGDALWSPGGKGANQAVAVARLGRRVAMVGAVGDDSAGVDLLANLERDSVDVTGISVLPEVSSGIAMIAVDADGENSIVVSSGANGRLTAQAIHHLVSDGHALATSPIVMAQFEVPLAVLLAVAELAPGRLLLNPAPALDVNTEGLSPLLEACSVLVPNQGELARLTGLDEAGSTDELVNQAEVVRGSGDAAVIITRGRDGALVVEPTKGGGSTVTAIPIVPVTTVDTTAAGDSFCGALADALVGGANMVEAAAWATRCAAVTVTRRGAQVSLPTRAEVLR